MQSKWKLFKVYSFSFYFAFTYLSIYYNSLPIIYNAHIDKKYLTLLTDSVWIEFCGVYYDMTPCTQAEDASVKYYIKILPYCHICHHLIDLL